MKIQCKECGVYFTIDQQDAAEHTGICDRCLNALPRKAEFYEEGLNQVVETKAQKKARQKAELEEAKRLEELAEEEKANAVGVKSINTENTPPTEEGFIPGALAEPAVVPSEGQDPETGEGALVETTSESPIE